MNFNSFLSDVLATVIGGLLLAILFFLAKERLFALPDITGRWYFELQTELSEFHPYVGMALQYVALLWLEGNIIHGTVEKIHEISSTGERSFVGTKRTRGNVQGYIQKNYLKGDRLFIHVIEDGHSRESTNFHDLTLKRIAC